MELALIRTALLCVQLVDDIYRPMIACRSCPIVRAAGLRMKARALVGHDRVLSGGRVFARAR